VLGTLFRFRSPKWQINGCFAQRRIKVKPHCAPHGTFRVRWSGRDCIDNYYSGIKAGVIAALLRRTGEPIPTKAPKLISRV
jgi:hypothetical protein